MDPTEQRAAWRKRLLEIDHEIHALMTEIEAVDSRRARVTELRRERFGIVEQQREPPLKQVASA